MYKCNNFFLPWAEGGGVTKEQEAVLPTTTQSTLARFFQGTTKPGDLLFKHEDLLLVRLTLTFELVLEAVVASLEPSKLELSTSSHGRGERRRRERVGGGD